MIAVAAAAAADFSLAGIIASWDLGREDCTRDDARSDATPQELAEVEPGHRRGDVHPALRAEFPAGRRRRRRRADRRASRRSTAATITRRHLSSASTSSRSQALRRAYGEQFNDQMLRQLGIGQRIIQQLVDEEADARRSGPARHPRVATRSCASASCACRLPGERSVHRRRSATAQFLRHAASAACRRPSSRHEVRRQLIAEKLQARRHRLDPRRRRRSRRGVPQAQREGEARPRGLHGQPVPSRHPADRRRAPGAVRREPGRLPAAREAPRAVSSRSTREALRAKMTVTPQEVEARYKQNQPTYSTPEQVRASHILLKTEGKDEAAVKKPAESRAREGQGRRRLRRAGEAVLRGRAQQGQRRRPRLLRPRHDGEGVRGRRLGAEAGRDQRPREVAVRLSHHQADRQEAPRTRGRSTKCGRSSKIRSSSRRRRPKPPRSPTRSRKADQDARPISTASRKARGLTVGDSGPVLARGAARRPRLRAGGRGRGVHAGAGQGQRRAPDQPGLRVHHARRDQAVRAAEARRRQGQGPDDVIRDEGGRGRARPRPRRWRRPRKAQLRGRGQGGRRRGEDHRLRHARLRAAGSRRQRGGRRRGVRAEGRRDDRRRSPPTTPSSSRASRSGRTSTPDDMRRREPTLRGELMQQRRAASSSAPTWARRRRR